jgi:ADP-heptose:LPS heptosyltransferase
MKHFNKNKQFWSKCVSSVLSFGLKPWLSTKRFCTHSPSSILIFDFHLIGDIVLLTPLLIELRRKNPRARIGLVAGPWAQKLLENHPKLFDEFYAVTAPWVTYDYSFSNLGALSKLLLDIRKKDWDWGIEVRGDLRQILLLFLAGAQRRISYDFTGGDFLLTDVVPDDGKPKHLLDHHIQILRYLYPVDEIGNVVPQLWLSDKEQSAVVDGKEFRIVGFHPGASLPLRQLPLEKAIELLRCICEIPQTHIHLFQGPNEQAYVSDLLYRVDPSSRGRIHVISVPLRRFVVELAKCDFFIGMDSGAVHIATALGVPVYVIFGPADPVFCRPVGSNVTIVMLPNEGVSCRPCDQVHCVHMQAHFCMNALNLESIGSRIRSQLSSLDL